MASALRCRRHSSSAGGCPPAAGVQETKAPEGQASPSSPHPLPCTDPTKAADITSASNATPTPALLFSLCFSPALHCAADPAKTVDITSASKATVEFTYSVTWRETDVPYDHRMDK